jgi:uncharacterized membrane-anchored protein
MTQNFFGIDDHPLRASLSNDMHIRKPPSIAAPARLMQIISLSENETLAAEHKAVAALCGLAYDDIAATKFVTGSHGVFKVIWERHT